MEECWGKSAFLTNLLHSYVSNRGWFRRSFFDKVTICNLLRKWGMGLWILILWCVWRIVQSMPVRRKYLVPTTFYTAWREWLPRDWFLRDSASSRTAMFEGVEVPIAFEAEKYLELLYGDWHKLPPVEARKGYLGIILPFTPCMHSSAMRYPGFARIAKMCGGSLNDGA